MRSRAVGPGFSAASSWTSHGREAEFAGHIYDAPARLLRIEGFGLTARIGFATICHPLTPEYTAQAGNLGDMDNSVIHKVVITGTGRAGTTLLMQILTRLGLDTGYSDIHEEIYENCHAGMERFLDDPKAGYVVKCTHLFLQLESLLKTGAYKIDHAFIPIRNIEDATASRIAVASEAPPKPDDDYKSVPGGLYHCYQARGQKNALGRSLYSLFYAIAMFDIPHTLIDFPRFAHDPHYLFGKLAPILSTMSYSTFREAFHDVVDLSLIHKFDNSNQDAA
jgi:hypothetical protein